MNEWMNEWMNKWKNEWINDLLDLRSLNGSQLVKMKKVYSLHVTVMKCIG